MYVSLGSRITHLNLGHLICGRFAQCDLSRADLSKLPQHRGWPGISLSAIADMRRNRGGKTYARGATEKQDG
jgi:hypothetical protein